MLHEPPPLAAITRRPCHPWLVVGLVSVGAFIGQLDATIVQLALPAMKTAFGVHTSTVSWVSLAYLLAFASFLPVFGRLCQMFGRKSLYLTGYALFTVATVLCGAATGIVPLIIFRVLQGIGGSLLGANSIAILISAMKGPQRGRALGYFAAAQAIGMSAGPAVGGLLLTSLGWQWVFWATVPFGIAAFVAGWLVLLRTGETDSKATFDWRGALLIGPALTALVLGLNQAAVWGIAAPATLGCLALSIALMVLLVWQERRISAPLVDLRLFASPAFTLGGLAVMLGYALLYGMFFLMSFVLVHGFHEGPLGAGLRMAVIPVALGITAALSGGAEGRLGPKTLSVAGMTSCVVGLAMLEVALRDATLPVGPIAVAFALFGIGLGVFIAPNNHETLRAAPASLSGPAGSLLNLMRILGTSLGVAAAAAAMTIAEGLTPTIAGDIPATLLSPGGLGLIVLAAMAVLAAVLCVVRPQIRPQDEGA